MIANLGPNKVNLEIVKSVGEPYLSGGNLVVPVVFDAGKPGKYIIDDIAVYEAFKAQYDEFCGVEPEPVNVDALEPAGELDHVEDLELDVEPEVAEEVLEEFQEPEESPVAEEPESN